MAGFEKRRRIVAALDARAAAEIGQEASALDYILEWVANGRFLSDLATEIARDPNEDVSRTALSHAAHRLSPEASERIAQARRAGADALAEDACQLLDDAGASPDAIATARRQSNHRRWFASRGDRPRHLTAIDAVHVSIGAVMHLQSLQGRVAKSAKSD